MPRDLLQYWRQALLQPYGVYIKVSDRVLLRQQLYRARDAAPNKEEFMGISVMMPKKPKDQLWLVKKEHSDA